VVEVATIMTVVQLVIFVLFTALIFSDGDMDRTNARFMLAGIVTAPFAIVVWPLAVLGGIGYAVLKLFRIAFGKN